MKAQTVIESVKRVSEEVNSEAEEIMPLLSNSGDSLFFSRVFYEKNEGGLYSGSDIWLSTRKADSGWSTSTNDVGKWNDKRNNFIVGISDRNHERILYLNNPKNPDRGIQFVKEVFGNWTNPELISIEGIAKNGYQGLYVSPDYEVILLSMSGESTNGEEDLYVSVKDERGNWKKPVNLGSTINTAQSEISPFLSKDKKTLYFASKGHGGFGDMDIFSSERLYNSWNVWSKPKNLGDKINSEAFDAYYSQYGDTLAYFSSNREGELADIYEVKMLQPKTIQNTVLPVADANTIAKRNYLTQTELKESLEIKELPFIQVQNDASINENAIAAEIIYFLINKLSQNPNLNLAIKVNVLEIMSTEKMVVTASQIASFIATEIQNAGINMERVQYDGVTIGNQNSADGVSFQVSFSFYK
ncbi:hypothetical protein [Marivirga lumbricoides]|uniref:hypothetical protein n=1 Tax=Marivirga lumbricoides TaxID=1046115 RepID=UPI0031F0A6C3